MSPLCLCSAHKCARFALGNSIQQLTQARLSEKESTGRSDDDVASERRRKTLEWESHASQRIASAFIKMMNSIGGPEQPKPILAFSGTATPAKSKEAEARAK